MLKEKNGFDDSLAAFENRKAEIKSQLFNPTQISQMHCSLNWFNTTLFLHIFSTSQFCALTFKSVPINFSYIYENLFTYFQERKHCKKS